MASFWMQLHISIMDASSYLRVIPCDFIKSLETEIFNVCFYAHFCVQFCAMLLLVFSLMSATC